MPDLSTLDEHQEAVRNAFYSDLRKTADFISKTGARFFSPDVLFTKTQQVAPFFRSYSDPPSEDASEMQVKAAVDRLWHTWNPFFDKMQSSAGTSNASDSNNIRYKNGKKVWEELHAVWGQ